MSLQEEEVLGKVGGESDENRRRACRNNKQDVLPGDHAGATLNFPETAPAKAHSFKENYSKEQRAGKLLIISIHLMF